MLSTMTLERWEELPELPPMSRVASAPLSSLLSHNLSFGAR